MMHLFLTILFLSCTSNETVLAERVHYILTEGWSRKPWRQESFVRSRQLTLRTEVDLDRSWPIEGAALQFEGLWWKGHLEINGNDLPEFYGGLHQVEIPIGEHLKHGSNSISLHIEAPQNTSLRVTGGTPSSLDKRGQTADLFQPPTLILRPKTHVSGLTIQQNDGKVTPIAWVSNQGESTLNVHFEAMLDGKKIADLGTCAVQSGRSNCTPQQTRLPSWNVGDPNLFYLRGTLLDATNNVVDQVSVRTAAREIDWQDGTLKLNGKEIRLMSARMVHRRGGDSVSSMMINRRGGTDFASRMQLFHKAGVNSIEVHGELLRQDWLEYADELGLPIVIVPRCVGRSNSKQGGSEDDLLSFMKLQDQRLLWDTHPHPSVTLFALEGDTSQQWTPKTLWTRVLLNNLHNIPVFGYDLPIRLLHLSSSPMGLLNVCRPRGCSGAWLVETVVDNGSASWEGITRAYADVHKDGALGGVIPTPNNKEEEEWSNAWQTVLTDISPTALSDGPLRSSSTIQVTGTANQTIEVSAPGLNREIRQISAAGTASIDLFHEGQVRVDCGHSTKSMEITANQWVAFALQPAANEIDCTPP